MKNKIFKVGLILLASSFYSLVSIGSAQAATLYFYPQTLEVMEGSDVIVELRLNTQGQAVNAVMVSGSLSNRNIILHSIENSGSLVPLFVDAPQLTSQTGFALTGGIPQGFTGDGIVARLIFRAESVGTTQLDVDADSEVYLHSGEGTKAELSTIGATLIGVKKQKDSIVLSSQTHPDQNQWYQHREAVVQWDLKEGEEYSYDLSFDPVKIPDDVPDRPQGDRLWEGRITFSNLSDGIYYFAVKKVGSSVVSRYRLMNDAREPVWGDIQKSEGTLETEQRPFLNFWATDQHSGIDYYEATFDSADPVTITSPYPLPNDFKVLKLKAFDRAGNVIEKTIPGPRRNFWPWVIVIGALFAWGVFGILKRRK